MQEMRVDGLYGRYYSGDKGTIVMLHGLLSSMGEFGDYPEKFNSAGYAVLIIDFEGHGKSAGKRGYESIEKNIKNLEKWIEHLKNGNLLNRPLIIMGHSLGAATTIYALARGIGDMGVALAPPSSIRGELNVGERIGLPLIYAFGKIVEKITGRDYYINYRVDYSSLFTDEKLANRARRLNYLENKLWIGSYKPLMSVDTLTQARKVHRPCMVVIPSEDRVVKPENGRRVYDALSGPKEIYIAEGYGHSIMLADRGDVFERILKFIERQRNK